ncbi:MAG: flagellar hook-associated protein FlgL [Planctomycetes bacterium]|nr:flagellar hook-associated protein FlgL [Planctomycetota bacterium]
MNLRPTQSSKFALVNSGLSLNFAKLALSQERIATGKRILRPSDDVIGTAKSLATRKQMSRIGNYRDAIESSRPYLESASSSLQDVSGILSEARALITQGMSGTLNDSDRRIISGQIEQLVDQLVDVANSQFGERYLFGGTLSNDPPFSFETVNGTCRVVYHGDDEVQRVQIGAGTEVGINVPGSDIFGLFEYAGAQLSGSTGATLGTSANQGTGYADLIFRHDATVGTPGAGIALANGGDDDTILQDHLLTVDATAGTVTLGNGTAVPIPQPGDADYADFVVETADGAEVHLDFTGWTGVDTGATLSGAGSVSLDGVNFTPLAFTETDLELVDSESGTVVHLDTTNVNRAGTELLGFQGGVNIFDALLGAASDLENSSSLGSADFLARMTDRLGELERNQENALSALGTLGARTERLNDSAERLGAMDVSLQGVLSQIEDADLATVALELSRAEQTLQLAQMTGSRLLQNSLLNFLR